MKKEMLFGSTGFVGSYLLDALLEDPQYDQVTVVVRKDSGRTHAKLKTLVGDLNSLSDLKSQMIADDVFITLGTTTQLTPDRGAYYQLDHDYPVLAARFAKENGAKSILIVTAVGANAKSNLFYLRTKGGVERDILKLDYQHSMIFQPSMILGQRREHRLVEKLFIPAWSVVDRLLLGPLKSYKGIAAKEIAKAMQAAAQNPVSKTKIYRWQEMMALQ